MQAITTKFIGPTNFRGSRIKAKCQAASITVSWDDALGTDDNHDKAAQALASKLGWTGYAYGTLVGGGLPDGTGNCYVFVKTELRTRAYRYELACETLKNAIGDLSILAGDEVGPSDASWQDVAGTASVNLRALASMIEAARAGNVVNGPVVFPSLSEVR